MKSLNHQALFEKLDNLEKNLALSNAKFIGAVEAAKFLGFSITYLYELTSKREIPFYKPSGKKLLFKQSDLTNWIEKSRHHSSEEINNELMEEGK